MLTLFADPSCSCRQIRPRFLLAPAPSPPCFSTTSHSQLSFSSMPITRDCSSASCAPTGPPPPASSGGSSREAGIFGSEPAGALVGEPARDDGVDPKHSVCHARRQPAGRACPQRTRRRARDPSGRATAQAGGRGGGALTRARLRVAIDVALMRVGTTCGLRATGGEACSGGGL